MAHEPKRAPGVPGTSAEPIKRAEDIRVPASWLLESDHLELADRIDRLAGDDELVTLLALGGYQGRDWTYFSTELARYGLAVFGGWMYTGLIYDRCRQKGFGLPRLDRDFTDDEIDELKGETVAKALHHFRVDVLMKRKWDSTKGATLRTYFIGQCIIRFANVYRGWYESEARHRKFAHVDDHAWLIDEIGPGREDTAEVAIDRLLIDRALAEVKDPRVRVVMVMTANGRSQTEIAYTMGVTPKTVERMLANERERQRGRKAG
ncbi:RNA polymerase sigma factor [Rhodococcus sp. IEGM1428]|uniref:RNA polymerase sigma factor n=1 Tax=Rhodococcus sp. IEGM1428 TaxID=3392191 RepID=UPI003D0F81ED